jgi:pilus assembly protein CpaF
MFSVTVTTSKGEPVTSFTCKGGSCTIGRSDKNPIRLQGWRIDAVHAELVRKEDGVYLHDRSAGAGISVNGEQVSEYGPLLPGDRIALSSYVLSIQDSEHPQQQDAAPGTAEQNSRETAAEADNTALYSPAPSTSAVHAAVGAAHPASTAPSPYHWHELVHQQLMEAMDLRRIDVEAMGEEELTEKIQGLIDDIISNLDAKLPRKLDRKRLAADVLNEAVGLGPLEGLLADDSVTEIMVNNFDSIYVERAGRLEKTTVSFSGNNAVLSIIERIVSPLGRRIDESSPMVDARLEDGSRVNAIIPPLAVHGPCLTIRKFSRKKLTGEDLVGFGSISPDMVAFLKTAVQYRKNIVVSGGTGSGKTTFLNVVSGYIPHTERIVTVEDSAELQLEQPHVVTLEARPANVEGKGAVTIRDLVRNCLRMRPDRIVVGECRGGEALDMLQAMNTGHDGSLTTVHANSPRDLISRLEVMVMMAGMELPQTAIMEQITSAVNIIVQQARFVDGSRRITHITEITGMEGGMVQMQNIFVFKQHGFDGDGRVVGEYMATGRIPEFYEELNERGLQTDMRIFENSQ